MATLPHVDLRGANLRGANLRGAMLWGALLDDACLDDADLTCADLTWSSLSGCSMKGALLVEADLDEALIDDSVWDAVTAGADMSTVNFRAQANRRMAELQPESREEAARTYEAKRARDGAVWAAHCQSASPALRKRGAAGFELSRGEPGFAGDRYAYKHEQLGQARARVIDDADLQDLLRWSASTPKPLNLRGCNLSGANLRNASLRGACLAFTDATGADLHRVDLAGADLQGARGWERPWWKSW